MSKLPVPNAALAQHVIVLGKTRSGKSSVMRLFVEHLLDAGKPVCIVDPKGDWWGLKSSASGREAGFPVVIFGGDHADVPINARAGGYVAELVATGNRPCIVDLGGWTVADRTRFFVDFAGGLFRHTRGPRWLVIDEVHNFAPQGKVHDPDAGKMLHWANRLASEGAGKGVTLISASQRPQKVHKDYVTSHETLVAMRVIHPLDRGAIKDWIDGCPDPQKGRDVLATLAGMQRGEGWVWSPEIGFGPARIQFPLFRTYDSFKAPVGESTAKLKGWATVDLDEVKAKLAVVVEEAKANDPKELRAEIARLRKEALTYKSTKAAPVDRKGIEEAERAGHIRGTLEANQKFSHETIRLMESIEQQGERLVTAVSAAITSLKTFAAAPPSRSAPSVPPRSPPRTKPSAPAGGNGSLSGPHQRIVDAIAWWGALGFDAPSRVQVAFVSGYKPNTGTFNTYLGALSSSGIIAPAGRGVVELTEEGLKLANAPSSNPGHEELVDRVSSILSGPQTRLLTELIGCYPDSMLRDELAEASEYAANTGTFNTYLGSLSSLGLISKPDRGQVRAAEWLFP